MLLSEQLQHASNAARVAYNSPAIDLRSTLDSFGDAFEIASQRAADLEQRLGYRAGQPIRNFIRSLI